MNEENEEIFLRLIESRDKKNYEKASNLYAALAMGLRPQMLSHVRSKLAHSELDKEDFVGEVICSGLERINKHFKGDRAFVPQGTSLKTYLFSLIGKLYDEKRASMMTTADRAEKSLQEKHRKFHIQINFIESQFSDDDFHERSEHLRFLIKRFLEPRESLVVKLIYDFDEIHPISAGRFKDVAFSSYTDAKTKTGEKTELDGKVKVMVDRFLKVECKIRSDMKFTPQHVASILDLSPRQVQRIKNAAVEKLKKINSKNVHLLVF